LSTSWREAADHVWTALRLLGLAGGKSCDKFVPTEYLKATPSARLALLQGIMDTDGYVADGAGRTAAFSSSSRALTEGVAELVKSLGGLCNPIRMKQTQGLPAYTLNFRLCEGAVPFRLRRKAERCNRGGAKLYLTVVSVKRTGRSVPMQCISVDANDSLYVTTGYTLTHNTFVALDMAMALVRGTPWRERRVPAKARVLYIAAEGSGGVGGRIKAYCRQNQIAADGLDLSVMYAAPNFMNREDITEVLAAVTAAGGFDLIIVDTFAQVTPGANENAAEDMGTALGNSRALGEASGAMILLIHHAGKDASKGSRGWSGLKAAADVQIEVIRHEDGTRELHVEKLKDGEDGLRWGFKLEIVELGVDTDGDPITSCIVLDAELSKPQEAGDRKGVKRRGRVENHVLDIMAMFGAADTVKMPDLVARAVDTMPEPEDGKRDTRRQHVVRAIQQLSKEKDGPLRLEGNVVVFYE